MSLFEDYNHIENDMDRKPTLTDIQVRPAVLSDVPELGAITAARESGDATEYSLIIEEAITSWEKSSKGIILVAEHKGQIVGFAKVKYFTPPDTAPANVAPSGWYLAGVIVVPEYRRRSVGRILTQARLNWIAKRDRWAYYFANAQNRVSIEMHQQFGFVELTRDFTYPGTTFEGGIGILFRVDLE
jgi:ribosomal protein S18 acetylase RimI-like enzyme